MYTNFVSGSRYKWYIMQPLRFGQHHIVSFMCNAAFVYGCPAVLQRYWFVLWIMWNGTQIYRPVAWQDNLIRDDHSKKKNCKLWSPLGSDSQPARPRGQAPTLNGPLATYSSSWSSLKRFRRNSDLETAAPISWDSRSRWALARGSGWAESWNKHDTHLFTFCPP